MKKLAQIFAFSTLAFSFMAAAAPSIELYKSPSCGCCTKWAKIMEEKGYEVKVHMTEYRGSIAAKYGMPRQLMSCHSAIIDGYMIEGHVPEADIAKLLAEKPANITGISAPGMPQFSPGMARPNQAYRDFDVVSFNKAGKLRLYNRY